MRREPVVASETCDLDNVHSRQIAPEPAFNLFGRCALHEREERLARFFLKQGWTSLEGLKILDVGCGAGAFLRRLSDFGAQPENCFGIDVKASSLSVGRRRSPLGLGLVQAAGSRLPFRDQQFDLVTQFTVFTSVLDSRDRQLFAAEIVRILRPGGWFIWYDFAYSNPSNQNVKGIGRREIKDLLKGCRLRFERVTLAPPIGRVAVCVSPALYHLLSSLYFLRTHYLCFAQKVATGVPPNSPTHICSTERRSEER